MLTGEPGIELSRSVCTSIHIGNCGPTHGDRIPVVCIGVCLCHRIDDGQAAVCDPF